MGQLLVRQLVFIVSRARRRLRDRRSIQIAINVNLLIYSNDRRRWKTARKRPRGVHSMYQTGNINKYTVQILPKC